MGLLINQGNQKEDTMFSIVEAENTVCQIVKVALHEKLLTTLVVSLKILKGDPSVVGKVVNDNVNYDPDSIMAWKYTTLRRCAGVPYTKGEPAQIDIEKLLLNKCVQVDFTKRLDKNGKEWQNCKYKKLSEEAIASMPTPNVSTEAKADGWGDLEGEGLQAVDEELPF